MATHYRLPLFRELSRRTPARFVFFSDGGEWYWQRRALPDTSGLDAKHLAGWWVGNTRITPALWSTVFRSEADVVIKCVNGKFALPVTYVATRLRRRPFVLWTGLWRHPSQSVHRVTHWLMRYLYRHADAVLTYGRHVSEYVISQGADPARVVAVPQAVDPRVFPLAADARRRSSTPVTVLFIGRLTRDKGPQLVVDAVSRLADKAQRVRLVMVGDGPLKSDLMRERDPELVEFLGELPAAAVVNEYRRADVVVVPSLESRRFSEPWSLVVNEAMSLGIPVIASDAVGAVRDGLLADGATGLVFPAGDTAALESALRRLVDDAELYGRLASAGRSAVASYSIDAAADAFVRGALLALRVNRQNG